MIPMYIALLLLTISKTGEYDGISLLKLYYLMWPKDFPDVIS